MAELLNCEPTEVGYDRNLAHSSGADVLDGLDRVCRFTSVGQGPRRITGRYMARSPERQRRVPIVCRTSSPRLSSTRYGPPLSLPLNRFLYRWRCAQAVLEPLKHLEATGQVRLTLLKPTSEGIVECADGVLLEIMWRSFVSPTENTPNIACAMLCGAYDSAL